jgi:hypothetical protein
MAGILHDLPEQSGFFGHALVLLSLIQLHRVYSTTLQEQFTLNQDESR